MKNKSRAFSLIELSIVILIIGVLIAGVTQASRLVRQSKLTTAKTLTQSSAVNSIKGLVLWLEPTMDNSFKSSEAVDTTALTTWYDINPQVSIPNTFTASSASIKYKANGATNALPAVQFAGTAASSQYFTGTNYIDTPFSAYTIFYVARSTNLTAANTVFYNGTYTGTATTSTGFGVRLTTSGYTNFQGYNTSGALTAVTGTSAAVANQAAADIVCITVAPNSVLGVATTTPAILSYRNGAADISTTLSANFATPTTSMYIGNRRAQSALDEAFIGEVSEIIVFDNVLKKSDRQEVEKYLSKKYAITITQN